MKKHIWADPTKEWEGFQPVAYSLGMKAWKLPLTQLSGEEGPKQEEATTVGKVLGNLKEQQAKEIESSLTTEITTTTGKVVLSGPSFNRRITEVLLGLQKDGINYFETQWFWFGSDSCRDDPHESYSFFVVYGDRIVRESVSFSDYSDSGFDPSVFESNEDSHPIWMNDPEWDKAWVRYWFRKFYAETRTGQLMVLRPDEPILYHYERSQARDIARDIQRVTLLKIYRLLWVALPLLVALARTPSSFAHRMTRFWSNRFMASATASAFLRLGWFGTESAIEPDWSIRNRKHAGFARLISAV